MYRARDRADVGEEHVFFLAHVLHQLCRHPLEMARNLDHFGVMLPVYPGDLAGMQTERLDRTADVLMMVLHDVVDQEVERPGVEPRSVERVGDLPEISEDRGLVYSVLAAGLGDGLVAAAAEIDPVLLEDGRGAVVGGNDVANGRGGGGLEHLRGSFLG